MSEQVFKRREARERLNVTIRGYQNLIDSGILAKPIRLTKNSHPLHTESQLRACERKLYEKANPDPIKNRISKPVSERMLKRFREARSY